VIRAEAKAILTTVGEAQALRIAGAATDDRHRKFLND